jgi:hypothetical protein
MVEREYGQLLLVLAIQYGLFVRAIVRALTAVLLVATLLRDGLFDPGGIGLPPSLTYKADFALRAETLVSRLIPHKRGDSIAIESPLLLFN